MSILGRWQKGNKLYTGMNGSMTKQLQECNFLMTLRWRHNRRDRVSNHQPRDCLLNRLLRRRSKKTTKRRVTGLCAGNSPGTGAFPAQMASKAENVSIWWRHHGVILTQWENFYAKTAVLVQQTNLTETPGHHISLYLVQLTDGSQNKWWFSISTK